MQRITLLLCATMCASSLYAIDKELMVNLPCPITSAEALQGAVGHEYMQFAPAITELHEPRILEGVSRGVSVKITQLRQEDIKSGWEAGRFGDYKNEQIGDSRYAYNSVETIYEFVKRGNEDVTVAIMERLTKAFKPYEEYRKSVEKDPMSMTLGGMMMMRREESEAVLFNIVALYDPSVTIEQRMRVAKFLIQNRHVEIGKRMIAWQAMRLNSADEAFGILKIVADSRVDWRDIEDFYLKFAFPYLQARWGISNEQLMKYYGTPSIWNPMVENQAIPHFFELAGKGEVEEMNLRILVSFLFGPNAHAKKAEVLARMKTIFLKNTNLLDTPAVNAVEKENAAFKDWLDKLI